MTTSTPQTYSAAQVAAAKAYFAQRLKHRMRVAGLTPMHIQRRANDGLLNGTISRSIAASNVPAYREGKILPTEITLQAFAYALGCQAEELLPTDMPRAQRSGRRRLDNDAVKVRTRNIDGGRRVLVQLELPMDPKAADALRDFAVQYAKKSGLQIDEGISAISTH